MSFDRLRLDFLKSKSLIVDLYEYLFSFSVEKIGKDWVGKCPYCDKDKHLYLYQNEGLAKCPVFVCYSCNRRGDSINLVEKGKGLHAGQAVMWFIYQWSGLTRDDFLRSGSEIILNDEIYRNSLNVNDSVQFDIEKKKREEELNSDGFDFESEILILLGRHIKENPLFIDELRQFVEKEIGGYSLSICGWDVVRYMMKKNGKPYYYWRALKKNYSPIHLGSVFDYDIVEKKILDKIEEIKGL